MLNFCSRPLSALFLQCSAVQCSGAAWDGTPIHINPRNPFDYVNETYTVAGQPHPCGYDANLVGGYPLSPLYYACPGTVGNSKRNQLIEPGLKQWDMSIVARRSLPEHRVAQRNVGRAGDWTSF